MFEKLNLTIASAIQQNIDQDRKTQLQVLIDYIQEKVNSKEEVRLNFICTHNSRRSQFSQIWAQTAAAFYSIDVDCFSGGVEVTAFNERAVASIMRSGFRVQSEGKINPHYRIQFSEDSEPILAFSKLYDDEVNPKDPFAAVMTCAHADENCPFIPSSDRRIAVRYEDPKAFDDSPLEEAKYYERSLQIASEMFYVFRQIKS